MNVIAIGGGDKTEAIKVALDRVPEENTEVLLVPSACSIRAAYNSKVGSSVAFFKKFGLASKVLHEFDENPSQMQVEELIGSANFIYTIGGNTPHLLRTIKEHRSDQALRSAIMQGTVHAGTSAGALLPFGSIHTNPSPRPTKERWDFALMDGLGAISGLATAHASKHDPIINGTRLDTRVEHLVAHFPDNQNIGLGIDDGAAVILGDVPDIIRTHKSANIHVIERLGGNVVSSIAEDPLQLHSFTITEQN